MKRRALIVGVTGIALLAPAAAYGFWTVAVTPGSTTATAASGVLAPAATATTRSSTAIDVTAAAPSGSGVIPTSYRVQRNGATLTGCDSLAFQQTCSDNGLSAGTSYTYTVLGRVGTQWVSTATAVSATTTAAPLWVWSRAGTSTITTGQTSTWTVLFSQPVSGELATAFQITGAGSAAASVASVTPSGPTPSTTWTVTSTPASGTGSLRLDLKTKAGIVDSGGSGLGDATFPISGGASATVTVNAPAPSNPSSTVAITGVSHQGSSGFYTFTGTSVGTGTVTVTASATYTAATCALGSVEGSSTASSGGGTWTVDKVTLTAGTTYYVRASVAGTAPASSPIYAVTAPTATNANAALTPVC